MNQQELIRVVVADDHPAMRGALARLVDEHDALELTGVAADGEMALELIERTRPDVALLDVRMPKRDGLAILARIRAANGRTKVLFISGYDDTAIMVEAISQGGSGFLSKEAEGHEISAGILAVAGGAAVLSPSMQAAMFTHVRKESVKSRLSSRERQLIALAADGTTTAEIAEQLAISPHTVKTYWSRIYEKLDVRDRASAITAAARLGEL